MGDREQRLTVGARTLLQASAKAEAAMGNVDFKLAASKQDPCQHIHQASEHQLHPRETQPARHGRMKAMADSHLS